MCRLGGKHTEVWRTKIISTIVDTNFPFSLSSGLETKIISTIVDIN